LSNTLLLLIYLLLALPVLCDTQVILDAQFLLYQI